MRIEEIAKEDKEKIKEAVNIKLEKKDIEGSLNLAKSFNQIMTVLERSFYGIDDLKTLINFSPYFGYFKALNKDISKMLLYEKSYGFKLKIKKFVQKHKAEILGLCSIFVVSGMEEELKGESILTKATGQM